MSQLKNVRTWIHGLIAAFIGGGAGVLADIAADAMLDGNVVINAQKLGLKALIAGAIFAGAYLKQSPLPPLSE